MCSSVARAVGAPRPHRRRKVQKLCLMRGRRPRAPGIYRFLAGMLTGTKAERRPTWSPLSCPHLNNALVASPRCHILRPGPVSINTFERFTKNVCQKRPSQVINTLVLIPTPLAGFELSTYGRFSGVHRGIAFDNRDGAFVELSKRLDPSSAKVVIAKVTAAIDEHYGNRPIYNFCRSLNNMISLSAKPEREEAAMHLFALSERSREAQQVGRLAACLRLFDDVVTSRMANTLAIHYLALTENSRLEDPFESVIRACSHY